MLIYRRLPLLFNFIKFAKVNSPNFWLRSSYSTINYNLNLVINGVSLQNYIKQLEKDYEEAAKTQSGKYLELQPVAKILKERNSVVENINSLEEFLNGKDEDLKKLAEEEKILSESKIKKLEEELLKTLLPVDKQDECDSIVLEINAGVGGKEAMLFASELFEMYSRYAEQQGWETQIADYLTTELGGIRHGSLLINGNRAFQYFKHEAGVHRVQRIPQTEKAGRIHTSTVSVVALPQPTEIEVKIEDKDLKFEAKRASGAGGQHVNTTDSAVRITHLPTGVAVECQVDRSQIKNKKIALAKLRALLYQRELDSQEEKSQSLRKTQVRTKFRNEKIRTYNFPQDRITDHRLQGYHVHNLKGFFLGGEALQTLIKKLDQQMKIEMLLSLVNNVNK